MKVNEGDRAYLEMLKCCVSASISTVTTVFERQTVFEAEYVTTRRPYDGVPSGKDGMVCDMS